MTERLTCPRLGSGNRAKNLFTPRSIRREASGGVISFSDDAGRAWNQTRGRFFRRPESFSSGEGSFRLCSSNYDVARLAHAVCAAHGWQLTQARFYTGIPEAADKPFWNHFWVAKLAQTGREGVHVFSRPLRYRNESVTLPGGAVHTALVGQEKGVDVRLALDLVSMAWRGDFDVALIFSQDQDLSEVADEIRAIGREQDRWIKITCAFPFSPASSNRRGINGADWLRLDRAMYDKCIDPRDYRPKRQ